MEVRYHVLEFGKHEMVAFEAALHAVVATTLAGLLCHPSSTRAINRTPQLGDTVCNHVPRDVPHPHSNREPGIMELHGAMRPPQHNLAILREQQHTAQSCY